MKSIVSYLETDLKLCKDEIEKLCIEELLISAKVNLKRGNDCVKFYEYLWQELDLANESYKKDVNNKFIRNRYFALKRVEFALGLKERKVG